MSITDVYEIECLKYVVDVVDVVDGINLELVDSEGGGEGEGSHVHRVFAINEHGNVISYIRVTGYYESYCGTEYNDDWTFVEPREVKVTQYFAAGE